MSQFLSNLKYCSKLNVLSNGLFNMHRIGQAHGLVWTPDGSSLVQIKTIIRKGTGKLAVDGDIGHDFLKGIEIAINLFHDVKKFDMEKVNITFTIPFPIDGVSAGLPLFVSLHSAFTKQPVNQRVAFTGALSNSGAILPVDAIGDKILAAQRGNCESIVFPMDNLSDLPQRPWGSLILCPVLNVTDALIVSVPSLSRAATL